LLISQIGVKNFTPHSQLYPLRCLAAFSIFYYARFLLKETRERNIADS
jgi:hypothetical protein